MPVPAAPKIYHIVHINRLSSIISDGYLWCDAEAKRRAAPGTAIGMNRIKQRRSNEKLNSHSDLCVGDCVPFYYCPRSVMLYKIHMANDPELTYRGGQEPIVHLEADLLKVIAWAHQHGRRWALTLSNAGSYYFEDHCDLAQLEKINWDAVGANRWSGYGISSSVKEGKQAEFLVEYSFPWELVSRIGVQSQQVYQQVAAAIQLSAHQPRIEVRLNWYY
ncbi:MAG: DUF4433 domain-containing protein [Truepera sp.]|nr:DUF4433 domain-containing protein [Truepera sp.]